MPRTPAPACLAAVALLLPEASGAAQTVGPQSFAAESATLTTVTGVLHGTLLTPTDGHSVPVVLIHAGSGPTDRDGNTPLLPGKNNSLRLLAEGLAARGIATLRIDKRGIGESARAAPSEAELRIETYVEDAAGWISVLRRDRRFVRVVVLGHSEGALITALAAARAGPDAYISLAGPARRASVILRSQLEPKLSGVLAQENERILSSLERGELVDSVPAPLQPIYRRSVQPYLISWFRYEPASVIRELRMPILIAQGATDLQVDPADAVTLHTARPDATYLPIAGMNHVLKLVDGALPQQLGSYGDSTLAVAPALLDGVAAFVQSLH